MAFVVLIPKREIEAWLLYDAKAIAEAFHEQKNVKLPGNPELVQDPKGYLDEVVWRKYRKRYLNTIDNARIAKNIRVDRLKASVSFAPHFVFTTQVRNTLKKPKHTRSEPSL
jgi:hypothetical protein